MTQHLIKLCVGVKSPEHLAEHWAARRKLRRQAGECETPFHITRMMPKRGADILDNGSLYWVIKGAVMVRQRIIALERIIGKDGISRCKITLDHPLIPTEIQPRRAFQGWRYLMPEDAPNDAQETKDTHALPRQIEAELRKLGAW